MSVKLTWLGHGAWLIDVDDVQLLLDPFLDDNPSASCRAESLSPQYILVSHGHYDHVADAASIAQRCGATVVSNYEICDWLSHKGVQHVEPMNLGGAVQLPFGRVKLTPAWHSSVLPDGTYGGNPGGFLLTTRDRRLYFACDTALFSDMRLIAAEAPLDVAVLPIGDRFTMGPADSIEAVKLLAPRKVLPAHFNTWPPIAQDAGAWAARVRDQTGAEPVVLSPGESCDV